MSSRAGLFDFEFNKKAKFDPEMNNKGIFDADFSTTSVTAPTAAFDWPPAISQPASGHRRVDVVCV